MNMDEKLELIKAIEESGFSNEKALKHLDVPRATYYRWVMLFNNAPTAGDVTNVHTYLDDKWN